jgi:competence protein ComEA
MSRYFKDYLSFSRSEKNALIILGFIFILIVLLNIFLPFIVTPERKLTASQLTEIKRIQAILNDTSKNNDSNSFRKASYKTNYSQYDQSENDQENKMLFVFDPNNTTAEEWRKLNVPEKVIKTITKYQQKGGRFYKKEDLRKIYGLDENVYDKLEPYININNDIRKSYPPKQSYTAYQKLTPQVKPKIDLNTATETDLDKLPSIGESFAKRIVKYRQMLGGYYQKEQLMEVYGFDTIRYNKIKDLISIDESGIVKIAINLADVKLLGKHPYIGFKNAESIVENRNAKGPYKSIQDIKGTLGDANYTRLSPYLKLWD